MKLRTIIGAALVACVVAGLAVAQTTSLTPFNFGSGKPAAGALVAAKDANNITTIDAVAAGQVLTSAGTGTMPVWSASPVLTGLDCNGAADCVILDADADTTISAPTDDTIDVEVSGEDVLVITDPTAGEHKYILPQADTHMRLRRNVFSNFDDFTQQTLTEADEIWILNSGGDAQAVDAVIEAAESGVVTLVAGNADGTCANDCSQMVGHLSTTADQGGLVFEARLHIDTAVTTVSACVGFTDVTTIEEPFSIGGSDAVTSTASDAVAFCYDTGADTDEWFFLGVAGDTDATGNAATGVAPTADTYQVFRIEVDSDGATARGYIDGTLVGTLSANAVTAATAIFPTVQISSTTTTSRAMDVDYIYYGYTR